MGARIRMLREQLTAAQRYLSDLRRHPPAYSATADSTPSGTRPFRIEARVATIRAEIRRFEQEGHWDVDGAWARHVRGLRRELEELHRRERVANQPFVAAARIHTAAWRQWQADVKAAEDAVRELEARLACAEIAQRDAREAEARKRAKVEAAREQERVARERRQKGWDDHYKPDYDRAEQAARLRRPWL